MRVFDDQGKLLAWSPNQPQPLPTPSIPPPGKPCKLRTAIAILNSPPFCTVRPTPTLPVKFPMSILPGAIFK
jgi:hypothetical protein